MVITECLIATTPSGHWLPIDCNDNHELYIEIDIRGNRQLLTRIVNFVALLILWQARNNLHCGRFLHQSIAVLILWQTTIP